MAIRPLRLVSAEPSDTTGSAGQPNLATTK